LSGRWWRAALLCMRCDPTHRRRRSGRPKIDTATKDDDDAAAAPAVCYRGGAQCGWRALQSACPAAHTCARLCNIIHRPVYGCVWWRRRVPACTRALTDTWVPRSSVPSRRCHHRRRARSSIRYYSSSSSSFPSRQKTVDYRAYWPHFSPDHAQQTTYTRARRPRLRPDLFRRTHTVSTAAPASFRLPSRHRGFCHCRTHTYHVHVIIATRLCC